MQMPTLMVRPYDTRFPKEEAKIYFAGSHLTNSAYSWFQPFLSAAQDPEHPTPLELTSFNEFANALTALYVDPNLEATSERVINKLTQTTSVSAYIVEFQRLRQYITWNKSAIRYRFNRGLK